MAVDLPMMGVVVFRKVNTDGLMPWLPGCVGRAVVWHVIISWLVHCSFFEDSYVHPSNVILAIVHGFTSITDLVWTTPWKIQFFVLVCGIPLWLGLELTFLQYEQLPWTDLFALH